MLKTGDVVFVMTHNNVISKVIAWAMGSKWSHSAIVYGEMDGTPMLCETSDFEVTINWFKRYIISDHVSIEVLRHPDYNNIIQGNEKIIKQECESMVGMVYGYLQLISLGLRRLISLDMHNFFRTGLVCCHVIGYALCKIPKSGFDTIDTEGYDTEEMYQKLKNEGWVTIYSKEGIK